MPCFRMSISVKKNKNVKNEKVVDLPSPPNAISHRTPYRGASRNAAGEYNVNVPLPDTTVAQGHEVRHQDTNDSVHTAAAHAGDSPRDTQLDDVARQSAAQTAEAEDAVREEQTLLAAEDIGQPAIQRLEGRQRQEIRRRDPACAVERVEIAAHPAVRRYG